MISVKFRHLEPSSFARDIVTDRLDEALEHWPGRSQHALDVTLSMYNSRFKPGPDLFGVKIRMNGECQFVVEKRAHNLYLALNQACDALQESLRRTRERKRTRRRFRARSNSGGPTRNPPDPTDNLP